MQRRVPITGDGHVAQAIQHEIDHCNSMLIQKKRSYRTEANLSTLQGRAPRVRQQRSPS